MTAGRVWLFVIGILTMAGVASLLILPPETAKRLTTEGSGIVETGAVAGYLACALLILLLSRARPPVRIALFLIPVVMALREMDLDKRWFTRGLFKSSQYFKGDVPWPEIVVSALILLGLAACVLLIISGGGRAFIADLRRWRTWALALVAAFILAAVSKGLDGLGRKVEPLGIELSRDTGTMLALIEEGLEAAIPVYMILAVIACRWRGERSAAELPS